MESLRRPLHYQIRSLNAMIAHCNEKLPSIPWIKLSKEHNQSTRQELQERFNLASTIKETRGFHFFRPDSQTKISIKRISNDEHFSYPYSFSTVSPVALKLKQRDFISATYDQNGYVGVISNLDLKNGVVLVNFMHPQQLSNSFHWKWSHFV